MKLYGVGSFETVKFDPVKPLRTPPSQRNGLSKGRFIR